MLLDDKSAVEEEGEEDGEEFFQLMTTTGKIVDVDPALDDGVLLTNRLPRNRIPSFWDRARSVFSASVLTQPEVEALREGEVPAEGRNAGPFKPSLLLPSPGAIHEEEEKEGVEQQQQLQLLDGAPSSYGDPFAATPRMSEEKLFSQKMDAEWRKYLEEEILLLRVERVNDMLEEGKKHEGKAAGRGRVANLPKSPWGGEGKLPQRSRSASGAGAPALQSSALASPRSRNPRRPSPLAPTLSLSPPSRNSAPVAATTVQLPVKVRPPAGGTLPLARTSSSPANAFSRPPKLAVPGGDAGAHGPSKLATIDRKGRNPVSPPEEVQQQWTPWRESSDRGPPRLTSPGARGVRVPSVGAALPRTNSGVKAAMAAAEAAATGGKRIRRVFESLKKMLNSYSKDDRALKLELPRGSALSTALRLGEISSSQRGAAWLAIACVDTEDDITRAKYASLVKQKSPVEREVERDVNRTFPYHQMFAVEKGDGQRKLFNVIKAYSVLDREVGYTQGMGFVAATLLMNMGEEDAFCCLVFLMYRCGLRAVFLPTMEQLQVRLYQLSQLVLDCLPILHNYFESKDIKPVMYAADWFLTLFSRSLPTYVAHRVFDIVFAERTTAIVFKLGIVLLQVCRRQLLQCQEMENSVYFIKHHMPQQLKRLPDADMEELVAKALRVELPFESLLRLEAEYELLAEEAATAAIEVQAAVAASEKAAASWASSRAAFEARLQRALEGQREAEARAELILRQFQEHLQLCRSSNGGLDTGVCADGHGSDASGGPRALPPGGVSMHDASIPSGIAAIHQSLPHPHLLQSTDPITSSSSSSSSSSSAPVAAMTAPTASAPTMPPMFSRASSSLTSEEALRLGMSWQDEGPMLLKFGSAPMSSDLEELPSGFQNDGEETEAASRAL